MYYGSEEFNNAIENTQGNALKTRLKFSDEEIIELVSSMRYYGGSNDADDLSIGNVFSAYVDVSAFTDKLLTGREFLLESGVKLSDGTYEYAPIGYFTVQTPNGDYDEVSFTAYDRMIKFEKVYSSSLTYPTDSAKVLNEICTMCGVTLATPITSPITIAENLKGYTCREVLGYIAGIHGFFACIDRFGELNLRWYSDTPIEKSLKTVWSFGKSQQQYEVEKVEIAKDSETSYTSGNGITTLYHSNPYATQEITNSIFGKLGGYSYMPSEVEMLDDIRLDPWDVVSVTYYDDITYKIPCMSIEHDFGATSTTIRAVGKTSAENEYRFTGPTIQYLNRMATDLLVANRVLATKVDAEYVQANAITTDNFDAKVAEIQKLVVEEIDGKYADIQLANIDIADVGTFFANSGILDDVLIENGAVTGVLKGVRIVGDVIEANTIKADSLILSGSEESLIYQINVNAGGLTAEQLSDEAYKEKLSGTDLVAQSVTANELAANSVTADKILAGSITVDKLNVANLSAISANLGTVNAGLMLSLDYNDTTGTGLKIDLNNSVISSSGKDQVTIFDETGWISGYAVTPDYGVIFKYSADYLLGQANFSISEGQLTLNSVNYGSSGITFGDVKILSWGTSGIVTPKLCTDLIYCDGEVVAKNVIADDVSIASGSSLSEIANLTIVNTAMNRYGGAYNVGIEVGTMGSHKLYRMRKSLTVPEGTADNAFHAIAHGISNVRDIWIDENFSRLFPTASPLMILKPNSSLSCVYPGGTAIYIRHSVSSYALTLDLYIYYTLA